MELKRRAGGLMCFALLLLGNTATALPLSGVDDKAGLNLDCTNDFDEAIFCQFEAQNCTEYRLTLQSNHGFGDGHCIFKQCDNGGCCCSVPMTLIPDDNHNTTVWEGGGIMEFKIIDVNGSRKPKAPTIMSVNESNGNFDVKWTTNMDDFYILDANVTYHKKGDTEKVSEFVKPRTVDGLKYHQILGEHLEPSTTYVISVKSYTNFSGLYSDSSNEWEFTTPKAHMSHNALLLTVIISLSIVAIILSSAIYGCYVKYKTKWWDTVAKGPDPKLLNMYPSEQKVLKPEPPIFSEACIEPLVPEDSKSCSKASLKDTSSGSLQNSSGFSTGSSCLSYANTEPADIIAGVQEALHKIFGNSPISPLTTNPLTEMNKDSGLFSASYNPCGVKVDDMNSGSSDFDNKMYFRPHQILTDSSEAQTVPEMQCDSPYHPSEGDIVICADQQPPACPLVNLQPVVSSLIPTDMSYQQCNADSGRFSYAEDSTLSSISSSTNTTVSCDRVSRAEAGCESCDEGVDGATKLNGKTEEATICDENPCYGCGPAGSHSFPPVDDDYQAFQTVVEHTFPEESFNKMPQSFLSPVVPGFINSVQGGQCLSELQRPFFSLTPADQSMPVITDSGYQSV